MFQKLICKFFGTYTYPEKLGQKFSGKRYRRTAVHDLLMLTKSNKMILLCICFSAALFFSFSISDSVQADILAATTVRTENRPLFQKNSPLSPLASAGEGAVQASADKSVSASSAAVTGVFHEANEDIFPISSGKQANQTSLVLVGAVLVALTAVVGLAIGRKET